MAGAIEVAPCRRYALALWLVFVLFAFRVVAQPLALVADVGGVLPAFESWHSATLPYGALLASQIAILVALGWSAWRFTVGGVTPRRTAGTLALGIGSVYFFSMVVRLVLGLTILSHVRWFASPLPTVFHLVLAASLLIYGTFHYRYAQASACPARNGGADRHGSATVSDR